jgi:hypothetical protein
MTNPNESNPIADTELRGLLEEYKTLREEILTAKGRRLQTMSLTVGAFGVILSLTANVVLGPDLPTLEARLAVAIGGGIALYGIVIPSLIMTRTLQQSIQRIGGYIRIFIEPRVPGLNWENRWQAHKLQHQLAAGLRGMSATYYFLSLLPLLLPVYSLSQNAHNGWLILVLLPFACWSVYLSYDMHAATSKGWKSQWQVDSMESHPAQAAQALAAADFEQPAGVQADPAQS